MAQRFTDAEITQRLSELQPDIPWANYYRLGEGGIETVRSDAGHFYGKAMGLQAFTDLLPGILRKHMGRESFEGLRCLDIGAAEGIHAMFMGEQGAREVIGLEGRQLYVDRANFVAEAKGLDNVKFIQNDVRTLSVDQFGQFDFVLCSGLLHHLNAEAFVDFTQAMADVTADTLVLYTHTATDWAVEHFKLKDAAKVNDRYEGFLFREHKDEATPEQRTRQVRASLDNTYSFWARETSLVRRLVEIGFKSILKVYEPVFTQTYNEREFRALWVLSKKAP